MIRLIIVLLLVLVLCGALPAYRHSPQLGTGLGGLGLVRIVLLMLLLLGVI